MADELDLVSGCQEWLLTNFGLNPFFLGLLMNWLEFAHFLQKNRKIVFFLKNHLKLLVLLGDLIGDDGGFSNLAFDDALCGIGNSLIDLLVDLFGEPIGETGCPNLVLATAL